MTIKELYQWSVENECEYFEAKTEWNDAWLDIDPYVHLEEKFVEL